MHAWMEAWLPGLGWVGFDPTNNTIAAERHIRVAVGRDYADVPPTCGVFKGDGDSELSVAVQVYPAGHRAARAEADPRAELVARPGRGLGLGAGAERTAAAMIAGFG